MSASPSEDESQASAAACGIVPSRSTESIAALMPATCHSFTSRYSCIASDARNDRLRPVFAAKLSRRFLVSPSTRTVKVVEGVSFICACMCTFYYGLLFMRVLRIDVRVSVRLQRRSLLVVSPLFADIYMTPMKEKFGNIFGICQVVAAFMAALPILSHAWRIL